MVSGKAQIANSSAQLQIINKETLMFIGIGKLIVGGIFNKFIEMPLLKVEKSAERLKTLINRYCMCLYKSL
jgi:hypothetical protein